jgi:hypothetical protein
MNSYIQPNSAAAEAAAIDAAPLKDKFWIWQNYFCLQIKLICILHK